MAKRAHLAFEPEPSFRVVERIRGNANTDFGVPHELAKRDTMAVSAADGKRIGALVKAAWDVFDAVAKDAPASLRKGPRGGGRDRDAIVDHVIGAETSIYARKLGLQMTTPTRGDTAGIKKARASILAALEKPSNGKPQVEKGWPQRYAARRIAWHALDHAWEMEDRRQ